MRMMAQKKTAKLFSPGSITQNLSGEFEMEVDNYKDTLRLYELLTKYREVFGPLTPPSMACPLVLCDLQLNEEWIGKPHKTKMLANAQR